MQLKGKYFLSAGAIDLGVAHGNLCERDLRMEGGPEEVQRRSHQKHRHRLQALHALLATVLVLHTAA